MTRLYFGITNTGGMIKGSAEVGKIREDFANVYTSKEYNNKYLDGLREMGYTNQKYAIEIKDFREEELVISDVCKDCGTHKTGWIHDIETCAGCFDDLIDNKHMIMKWEGEEYDDIVFKLPQSFQYIVDPHTSDKAILYSIHQKWFNMIASGEKKYLFTNVLPKLLRGER